MQTKWVVLVWVLGLVWGCEEADSIEPTAPIEPLPEAMAYVEPGSRSFTAVTSGDRTGRARFCDEAEATAQTIEIVRKDIVPDVSAGGIQLWDDDGKPISVDTLIGRPEDGRLCDPSVEVDYAFAWGPPPYPLIVFFNEETRLLEQIQIGNTYLGVLKGEVEGADGKKQQVLISPREHVRVGGKGNSGGRELVEYASSAEQAQRPNSWLNHDNINLMHSMIRQTFFDEEPKPEGYDCVVDKRCDIIYTSPDESTLQETLVLFQDSGVQLQFTPTGDLDSISILPVRKAEFEVGGEVSLQSEDEATKVNLTYVSDSVAGCVVDLAADMTFAEIRDSCIDKQDQDRQLARADYGTEPQRDAVEVDFEGVNLNFLRDITKDDVFRDGERPKDGDRLYAITYTRSLLSPTRQFVASELAASYRDRLRERLAAGLTEDAPADHPFLAFDITLPEGLSAEPQRIGELEFTVEGGRRVSFVPVALAEVRQAYDSMTDEQRQAVLPGRLSDVALVEPFVDAVMAALSGGKSDEEGSFKLFQTVDNERWSIGRVSFFQDGEPYRLMVQYSLYFGAVTAVTLAKGFSQIDGVLNAVVGQAQEVVMGWTSPYYDLRLALPGIAGAADPAWNPYCLGCSPGIEIGAVDRLNNTIEVALPVPGEDKPLQLTVPGALMEDRSGFMRQLRGERFEFVPAHRVNLYGKEVSLTMHVMEDGSIGRLEQGTFKGAPSLCPGLQVRYGDNVRERVQAWQDAVDESTYQTCDLIFNYSPDGHVLDSVASLSNRITFFTTAERAVGLALWQ